ncbi:hypothetical protein ACOJBM_26870 [Rhizobium beringeri]
MGNTDLQINRPDDLQGLNVISPEPAHNPKSQSVFGENHTQIQSDKAQRILRVLRFNVHRPKVCSGFENMHT